MAASQPDRPLRLMIARLGKLQPDDMDSILATLDDDQRSRAISLLAEFDGNARIENDPEAMPPFDEVFIPDGVSPWLAARINGHADSGEETTDRFSLTPHAQSALRRCAVALAPAPTAGPKSPSLLDRVWSRLT